MERKRSKLDLKNFKPAAATQATESDAVAIAKADAAAAAHGFTSREGELSPPPKKKRGRPRRGKPVERLNLNVDIDDYNEFVAMRDANGWTSGWTLKILLKSHREGQG